MEKQKVFVDIETSDPDDVIALIYLLGVDHIEIIGVTIHPGSQAQIDLIKFILSKFNKDHIPVGSYNYNHKFKLSPWYTRALGDIPKSEPCNINGGELMFRLCGEDTILFTAGPNKNLGEAMKLGTLNLKAWYPQGGFAGDNVVPNEYILDKFKGKIICPTSNFDGSKKESLSAIQSPNIKVKYACSKNVCHNVIYDKKIHKIIKQYVDEHQDKNSDKYKSIELIYDAMNKGYFEKKQNKEYFEKKQNKTNLKNRGIGNFGKKMHDVLPAVCMSDLSVCEWKEVDMFYETKGWGCNLKDGTNVFISINYDEVKFWNTFLN